MGLARNGSTAGNSSGDIFIAFSTANKVLGETAGTGSSRNGSAAPGTAVKQIQMLPGEAMDGINAAVVQATEEAIINALCAATTTEGKDGNTAHALPAKRLVSILRKYNRLERECKIQL